MIADAALPPVWIVGGGRLGRALRAALAEGGTGAILWPGRQAAAGGPPPAGAPPELLFLSVPDGALPALARALARMLEAGGRPPVLHSSGAHGAEVLGPLAEAGFPTGSCHPLQSFPESGGGSELFRGIVMAIDGQPPAQEAARDLAMRLGATAVEVPSDRRALYHLAASLAANGLVGLLGAAMDALTGAGFTPDAARTALAPLSREALTRAFSVGPAAALTGPVARGDRDTLERHRGALRSWDATRLALYEALVREQERLSPGVTRGVRWFARNHEADQETPGKPR